MIRSQNKILVAGDGTIPEIIASALADIPELILIGAESEERVAEQIYTHDLVVVIIDEDIMDCRKVAAALVGQTKEHIPPLLIMTPDLKPKDLLQEFKSLQIDYILKPFNASRIQAKINLFLDLYQYRRAMGQSIDELDRVYRKIIDQHEMILQEETSRKKLVRLSRTTAKQIQLPLNQLKGAVYQMMRQKNGSDKNKRQLSAIRTASERISQITRSLYALSGKTKVVLPRNLTQPGANQRYKILYVQAWSEYFLLFRHFIKSAVQCDLVQAESIKQGLGTIADQTFDLIFTDHRLPDGQGTDLLSGMIQMGAEVPVVYILDKATLDLGPKVLAKGAFTYLPREEISGDTILSTIYGTLQKAGITRDIEYAQSRIVTISMQDRLTRLCNRRCFEKSLHLEITKAERYKLPLSVLMINFGNQKHLLQHNGSETVMAILRTSAGLVQSLARELDIVCRYSSDEFGIILANTDLAGARALAQRIEKRMKEHKFKKASVLLSPKIGIGIAELDLETGHSSTAFVRQALDDARKNCVA